MLSNNKDQITVINSQPSKKVAKDERDVSTEPVARRLPQQKQEMNSWGILLRRILG